MFTLYIDAFKKYLESSFYICFLVIFYLCLFVFVYFIDMQSRGYRGSRESLHSGMTYSARRGSNASMYEGE